MQSVARVLSTTLRRAARFIVLLVVVGGLALPAMAATTVTYSGSVATLNFGTVNIGSPSNVSLSFSVSGGAIGSVELVTQGAPNLDFTNAGGGTCVDGTTTACTVEVTFKPLYAGLRSGAVVFYSGAGNTGTVLAMVPVYGIGTGPEVTFQPGVESTLGSGFSLPYGAAVDGSGNVFVADIGNYAVYEILKAGGYATVKTLGRYFGNPEGVAVDGSGNVFVAAWGESAVYEVLAAGGYTTVNTLGSSFNHPSGVAVDGSGNVFVADTYNNAVKEILAAGGYTTVNTLGSGFSKPKGVAVDGNGNVFVADTNQGAVKEILAVGGYSTVSTLVSGFSDPEFVAVDGSGDVYVAQGSISAVKEILAVGGSIPASPITKTLGSGFSNPEGVAVDGRGNVFVADTENSRVVKLDFADPPLLSFATTAVGSTSSDSPQKVIVENVGNQVLNISTVSFPADFSSASDPNACIDDSSLNAGQDCDVLVQFTPQSMGLLNENVTLTDNNLNVTGATQSIDVTGIAPSLAPPPSLSANSLSFGSVPVGSTSASQSVTLTNTGESPMSITSIAVTGANASSFGFSNSCGTSLAAGANCTIHGHFAPTTNGALSAAVTITDYASGSPQSITLSGTGGTAATVSLSSTSLAFGYQTQATTSASQSVTMTNTGGSTLSITSIAVTGTGASMFAFSNSCGTSLAAGANCSIHGHFSPATTGAFSAAVTITDSASGSPQKITLSGTGVTGPAVVSLSSTSVAFGNQAVGTTSASQTVTLTNTGGAPLTITSIAVTGTGASSYVFSNSCGTSVAAGANCTIHGHFTPATSGALTAAITITDSASGSPHKVTLSGTGTSGSPVVSLSATSLTFASQAVGTTSTSQSVTLTNTGGSPLTITSIAVTGANASSFGFANSCGTSLAAGANCSIHGHFAPTTSGALSASVTITDNAGGSPQSISLSGTGN